LDLSIVIVVVVVVIVIVVEVVVVIIVRLLLLAKQETPVSHITRIFTENLTCSDQPYYRDRF
jgi:hypothetical protein